MAIVFKDKELREDFARLDIAFLALHELCVDYGVYTQEMFESKIKLLAKEEGKENEQSNNENNNN